MLIFLKILKETIYRTQYFFFLRITQEHHELNIKVLQIFPMNLAEIIF